MHSSSSSPQRISRSSLPLSQPRRPKPPACPPISRVGPAEMRACGPMPHIHSTYALCAPPHVWTASLLKTRGTTRGDTGCPRSWQQKTHCCPRHRRRARSLLHHHPGRHLLALHLAASHQHLQRDHPLPIPSTPHRCMVHPPQMGLGAPIPERAPTSLVRRRTCCLRKAGRRAVTRYSVVMA